MSKPKSHERLLISLGAAAVAAALIGWAIYGYVTYRKQLSIISSVKLQDTRDDVIYKLGSPTGVYGERKAGDASVQFYYTDPSKDPAHPLPPGTGIADYPTWVYMGTNWNTHLDVKFDAKSGRVSNLTCSDFTVPSTSYCPNILGIHISDSEPMVLAIMGDPTRNVVGEGVKTLVYDDVGLVVRLKMQHVYSYQVFTTSYQDPFAIIRFIRWSLSDYLN